MRRALLITKPSDGTEITWAVGYRWSRPRKATYLDPPEGGVEITGEPRPVAVTWWPMDGPELTLKGIDEGSILDWWLSQKYPPPSDEQCLTAAMEDCAEEDQP